MKLCGVAAVFPLLCICVVSSHHVLFVHTMGSASHLIQMAPLAQELVERGHQVTGIFYASLNLEHRNYTEIVLPFDIDGVMKEASRLVMEKGGTTAFNLKMWVSAWQVWDDILENITHGVFEEELVTRLLDSPRTVDAVITFMHSGAFFAEYFDCPLIQFSPAGPISFLLQGTGNVVNPSVQPLIVAPFIEPMTFVQRIITHLSVIGLDLLMQKISYSIHAVQKTVVENIANPTDILRKRTSLVIACSHFVTHGSWPYTQNVIEVGGLQLKDPKPLPQDLQLFMDTSVDGVIFVSFGSFLRPEQMPKEKINVFIEAFRDLKMSVIWKWDGEVPNLPKNVKISPWLPQQDLLGHPNLKLFVTHGGLVSLVEAIYHKAVILGIPFSYDQRPNLLRATRHGYAKMIEWNSLTTEELVMSIRDAIQNETMRSSMERIHNVYIDREEKPVEKAAWWVEYVCRHKGADFLKSGAEQIPWYQYHHVDIFIFLGVVFLCTTGALVLFCKICCKICLTRKIKSE